MPHPCWKWKLNKCFVLWCPLRNVDVPQPTDPSGLPLGGIHRGWDPGRNGHLNMRMGHYPLQSIAKVDFLVIWVPSAYNAILGWLGLNAFCELISTYLLKMKFLMVHGIREIYGDQSLVCHCYRINLQGNKATNAYPIEGLDIHDDLAKQWGELVEDLIPISLADGNPRHTIKISSNLD